MSTRPRPILLILLLILTSLGTAVHADDATAPLTLDDIRKLRQDQKPHDEIVALAAERGLAFDVTGPVRVQLNRMRFTTAHIEALREARESGPGGAAPATDDEEQAEAPKRTVNPNAPLGPRKPDAWHAMHEEIVKEIIKRSNARVGIFPAHSFNIVASEATAREHMSDATRIQQMLGRAYGGVFKSGLDRRSAHIALLDDNYQYQQFIDAMFDVLGEKGMKFEGQDPKGMAKNAASFSIGTMAVINLSKIQRGKASRTAVVYQIGCMMMKQLTDGRATDAMVTGFGNVCETLLYNQPSFTTVSYEPRNVNGADSWANLVRTLVRENRLARPHDVLQTYSTASMQMPNYAEAWSLMTLLSRERDKFEPFVVAVRDAPENTPVISTVEEVYKIPEPKLHEGWKRFAQ